MHPQDFYGAAKRAPSSTIDNWANMRNIEPEVLWAVAAVESPRGAYLPDGRPYILFESHVFGKLTKYKFNKTHPKISARGWAGPGTYGASGAFQYTRLEEAMRLDESAALQSCSWGRFQIMGFHWKMLGFSSVQDMVKALVESEANQFLAFFKFMDNKGIIPALQAKDWDQIAYRYNGSGYRKNRYHIKMRNAYTSLTSNVLRRGMKGPKVANLQLLLRKHSHPEVRADSHFGPATERALMEWQKSAGVTPDGIAGPQTLNALAVMKITPTPKKKSKRIAAGVIQGGAGVTVITSAILPEAESINEKVQRIKQIAGDNPELVEKVQQIASEAGGTNWTAIILGCIVIGLAGYVIWTKFYDDHKLNGVE